MQYENTTVESRQRNTSRECKMVAIVQYVHILNEGASYSNNSDGISQKQQIACKHTQIFFFLF